MKQSNMICPECRETSVVPSGGVKQLPPNFFIANLLDDLKHRIGGEEEAKCDHCTRNDLVLLCQVHELELSFYCETCNQLVCQKCTMEDHLKHDHDTVKIWLSSTGKRWTRLWSQ